MGKVERFGFAPAIRNLGSRITYLHSSSLVQVSVEELIESERMLVVAGWNLIRMYRRIIYTVPDSLNALAYYFFCSPSLGGSGFGVGSLNWDQMLAEHIAPYGGSSMAASDIPTLASCSAPAQPAPIVQSRPQSS